MGSDLTMRTSYRWTVVVVASALVTALAFSPPWSCDAATLSASLTSEAGTQPQHSAFVGTLRSQTVAAGYAAPSSGVFSIEDSEIAALLQQRVLEEQVDIPWSEQAREEITKILSVVPTSQVVVRSTRCAASLCVVEASSANATATEELSLLALSTDGWPGERMLTIEADRATGEQRLLIGFAREGVAALSDVLHYR